MFSRFNKLYVFTTKEVGNWSENLVKNIAFNAITFSFWGNNIDVELCLLEKILALKGQSTKVSPY